MSISSHTGKLFDWEYGDRSAETLKLLLARLAVFDVQFYCTDEWEAYTKLLPAEKLVRSKRIAPGIERNNCRNRH